MRGICIEGFDGFLHITSVASNIKPLQNMEIQRIQLLQAFHDGDDFSREDNDDDGNNDDVE